MFGHVTYTYDAAHHLLAYGNLVLNTAFLALFIRFRGLRILEPAAWYLVFHYLLFAFRPAVLFALGYHANYSFMGIHPDPEDTALTLLVTNVALAAFLAGSALRGRASFPEISAAPGRLQKQAFLLAVAVFAPLFLFSVLYGLRNPLTETNAWSSGNVMIDPETGKKIFVAGSGYFYVLKNCIPGILIAHILLYRPNAWNLSASVAFMSLAFLEGRGRFIIIYFVLGLIIYYFQRPKVPQARKAAVLLSFSLLSLLLISIGGVYRRITRAQGTVDWSDFEAADYIARTPLGDSQEFGMFEFLSYIVKFYPDQQYGFSYFTQYLEVLTKPIPRSLWSGKPVGSPVQLVDLEYFGNFQGLTQSLPGAGWLSLGIAGVVLLSLASGYFYQSFYCFCARRWNDFSIRAIYIVSLPFCLQWFRDGAPSIVEFYAFGLYPLIFWAVLVRLAKRGSLPMKSNR